MAAEKFDPLDYKVIIINFGSWHACFFHADSFPSGPTPRSGAHSTAASATLCTIPSCTTWPSPGCSATPSPGANRCRKPATPEWEDSPLVSWALLFIVIPRHHILRHKISQSTYLQSNLPPLPIPTQAFPGAPPRPRAVAAASTAPAWAPCASRPASATPAGPGPTASTRRCPQPSTRRAT